ncbi:hypothetical protein BJY01DRAFT_221332 [Aspergillus pseudoustus]|uniref:Uncharacterized protein n=1 Tax=Aspergillus pseudoustus TaxID=1810923 RepID=A0ABR4JAG6_9EURO
MPISIEATASIIAVVVALVPVGISIYNCWKKQNRKLRRVTRLKQQDYLLPVWYQPVFMAQRDYPLPPMSQPLERDTLKQYNRLPHPFSNETPSDAIWLNLSLFMSRA